MHLPRHLAIKAAAPPPDRPALATRPTPRISAIDDSPRYTFASAQAAQPPVTADNPAPPAPTPPSVQLAAAGAATVPQHWPQYALVGMLLLGIAAVYLIPRSAKDDGPLA